MCFFNFNINNLYFADANIKKMKRINVKTSVIIFKKSLK